MDQWFIKEHQTQILLKHNKCIVYAVALTVKIAMGEPIQLTGVGSCEWPTFILISYDPALVKVCFPLTTSL